MSVAVRMAGVQDAAALSKVAAVTFGLACPPGTEQHQIDAFVAAHLSETRFTEYLADVDRALLLVEKDGEPVGYTMLVFGEPSDPDVAAAVTARPTVELSKVYLLPGLHGTGASSTLMRATIDVARDRGVAGIWLGVNQQNLRANSFYERSGFAQVGVKKFLVGDEVHDDFVRELVF
ncbi:MAG TPA: GNAT family N-acetyltransferase [Homoserinimonas sp.]|nr:GNAT family N-acetyltransferase [Homoserinimonas sp.]